MKTFTDMLSFVVAIIFAAVAFHFAAKPEAMTLLVAKQESRVEEVMIPAESSVAGLSETGALQTKAAELGKQATLDPGDEMASVSEVTGEDQPVDEQEPEPYFRILLPTENTEIFTEPASYYMHTNRYKDGINLRPWQGGKYGFVRTPLNTNQGVVHTKLHEGIDIKPMRRDASGKPLDEVRTISDGQVMYVNSSSSRSNYGKYIVVRHDWPDGAFYSLYAHLATTEVKYKQMVKAGEKLGIMGYTGAGIDRERAHVHVELAFMMTDRYNSSYSPGNGHYNYNGLNLVGMDIGRFLRKYKDSPRFTIRDFLDEEEPYFTVRTRTSRRPGLLRRHPWLGKDMEEAAMAKSWEITFARSGVPLEIRPSTKSQNYATVIWVKDMATNHSYMTAGRLLGSGKNAKLSSRGHRHITLISESF